MLMSVIVVSPSSLPVVATATLPKRHGGLLISPDLHHFLGRYPHCRHRVVWTDPAGHTIWLAVHYG
jgi:hypothetical protein